MRPIIRAMKRDDWNAVSKIHEKIFSGIGESVASCGKLMESSEYTWFVAESPKAKIIGYTACRPQGAYLYWSWLGVLPSLRCKGVGGHLLGAVERLARKEGYKAILGDSRNRYRDGLIFHLKQGFEIIGSFLQSDGELMIRIRKSL